MTAPTNTQTCYRHPDRVAGIRCQRCDRPICPDCMHTASVGFHCPECSAQGRQREYRGIPSLRQRPVVVFVLIALNVAAYVAAAATSGSGPWTDGGRALALRGWGRGLDVDGLMLGSFVPEEPWRLVTGGFLHAGLLHIALNMWVLYILGSILEPAIGRARFAAVYATSLLAGSLGVVLVDPRAPTVGASGAVYGLMGALVVLALDRGMDLRRSGLLGTIGINLAITFLIPGISIGGHLGGLAGGALAGLLVTKGAKALGPRGGQLAVAAVLVLGVACAGVAYGLMQARYGV